MTTARYIVGVLLLVGLPPGVLWWFVVHPFIGFWRRLGVKPTLWTMGVGSVLVMSGLYWVRDPLMGPDLGTSWPLVALAAVLAGAALTISMKRKRYLTPRILAGVPELEARGSGGTLLTEGPYAVIRHPRYVEVALAVLAYAFFSNFVGVYVVALATVPALHGVVVLEERELSDRFGEAYAAYRSRVPRYVPRWRAP